MNEKPTAWEPTPARLRVVAHTIMEELMSVIFCQAALLRDLVGEPRPSPATARAMCARLDAINERDEHEQATIADVESFMNVIIGYVTDDKFTTIGPLASAMLQTIDLLTTMSDDDSADEDAPCDDDSPAA